MSDTTARVLRLLNLLQARPVWTGPELSRELGVTTRSIRRDVERLRGLGYPVRATQGAGGGYQLGAGKALPPLLLDDDEAVTVAMALGVAASNMDEVAARTMAKLDQVMPERLRHKVSAIRSSTELLTFATEPVAPDQLLIVSSAVRDTVRITFSYTSRKGDDTERRVEPYRLVATGRRWYLFAWDVEREDWRTFRLDRVSEAQPSTWRFTPREAPDPVAFVHRAISQSVYKYVARIRIDAPYDEIAARVPPSVGSVERDTGGCILTAGADDYHWLLTYVASMGQDFRILEPAALKAEAELLARRFGAAAR